MIMHNIFRIKRIGYYQWPFISEKWPLSLVSIKVAVRAEILPKEFLQTLGSYYLSLTTGKIQSLEKFRQFLKAFTVKLSVFKNKRTSHPDILIKVYK